MSTIIDGDFFYNEDCIQGSKKHLESDSIDLIISDPPYGISGDSLHKHYNRKEEFVIDGYVEVDPNDYQEFSEEWISEAARVLRPGGSLYVVSGYTNLIHILNALKKTNLQEINHIIWKYNFGVYTQKKFVSSHYHILYYVKPGGVPTFNTYCRFGSKEQSEERSLNYQDREDVWIINREYKPGQKKNKNTLPSDLLTKIIQYSSNEEDLIVDFFLGSFSTAKVARSLNRRCIGFEISSAAFSHQLDELRKITKGEKISLLRIPDLSHSPNQGKPWSDNEKRLVYEKFAELRSTGYNKKESIDHLCKEFGRGRFSIAKILKDK